MPFMGSWMVRAFPHLRVLTNLSRLFVKEWWINKEFGKIWLYCKYEKLQDIYYSCGMISHQVQESKLLRNPSIKLEKFHSYSSQICVSPLMESQDLSKVRDRDDREDNRWHHQNKKGQSSPNDSLQLDQVAQVLCLLKNTLVSGDWKSNLTLLNIRKYLEDSLILQQSYLKASYCDTCHRC